MVKKQTEERTEASALGTSVALLDASLIITQDEMPASAAPCEDWKLLLEEDESLLSSTSSSNRHLSSKEVERLLASAMASEETPMDSPTKLHHPQKNNDTRTDLLQLAIPCEHFLFEETLTPTRPAPPKLASTKQIAKLLEQQPFATELIIASRQGEFFWGEYRTCAEEQAAVEALLAMASMLAMLSEKKESYVEAKLKEGSAQAASFDGEWIFLLVRSMEVVDSFSFLKEMRSLYLSLCSFSV
jgi:hypothetical protein